MGYSGNTTTIVSCVQWETSGNGMISPGITTSRAFRKEENAQKWFEEKLKYYEERGYSVEPMEHCEGFYGSKRPEYREREDGSRMRTVYFMLFTDRNPPS